MKQSRERTRKEGEVPDGAPEGTKPELVTDKSWTFLELDNKAEAVSVEAMPGYVLSIEGGEGDDIIRITQEKTPE